MRLLSLILTVLLAACSSPSEHFLQRGETALDTDGSITVQYHSALYYPTEISLRYDGYIVGIEKSAKTRVAKAGDILVQQIVDAGLSKEAAAERLSDSKVMFVSHVIQNFAGVEALRNKAIYSAYQTEVEPIPECARGEVKSIEFGNSFRNSWSALERLKCHVESRLLRTKYSHVIVLTMGWNTVQEEAVRNFNSILTNLDRAYDKEFNPLVIGVTWPSQWNSPWIDPVYKILSFPTKANDADEVGLTWLGVLLHHAIPNTNTTPKVVAIGHSFGSRALSVAACVGPAITEAESTTKRAKIHTLINLQGAFQSRRLLGEEEDGLRFPNRCNNVENFVLTASSKDSAVKSAFWGRFTGLYAGDIDSFSRTCGSDPSIRCASASPDGTIARSRGDSTVTYIDASELITQGVYQTGGGAHSDIYRRPHGTFMKNVIERKFGK